MTHPLSAIQHIHQDAQAKGAAALSATFSPDVATRVRRFHQSIPQFNATPLYELSGLAATAGVAQIWLKDESPRFGLNAFKALGGSYATGCLLAERAGISPDEATFTQLIESGIAHGTTFATATDGNHGRGVAWSAAQYGAKAVIMLPKGTVPERVENIRKLGAQAEVTDCNYDDTVRLVAARAAEEGWTVAQDTSSFAGDPTPLRIMQGYTTLGLEVAEALESAGQVPSHIFLQCGVGAMAGALAGFFAQWYGEKAAQHNSEDTAQNVNETPAQNGTAVPRFVIVEPTEAGCMFATAAAGDGEIHAVTCDLESIMAGLNCGEPCRLAWDILCETGADFVVIPNEVAAHGMRTLARPAEGDPAIVSGESGAATAGLVALLDREELSWLREALGITADARILLISTEGATDQAGYDAVVNQRAFPLA